MVATLGQRTLAESRPTANQPGQEPDGTPVPPAPKRVDAGAHLQSGIIDDGTAKGLSAQTLAEVRQHHRHHHPPKSQRRMPRVPASYPHMPQTT